MEEMTTLQDIIKKSVLSSDFANTLSISDIGASLFITFLVGMFIFYIYRSTFQGVLYTQSFNISLVMIALITSLVFAIAKLYEIHNHIILTRIKLLVMKE